MNLETEGCQFVWLCRKMDGRKSGLWLCHLLRTMQALRWHGLTPLKHLPSAMGKDQSGLRRRSLSTGEKTEARGKEWSPKVIQLMSDA